MTGQMWSIRTAFVPDQTITNCPVKKDILSTNILVKKIHKTTKVF